MGFSSSQSTQSPTFPQFKGAMNKVIPYDQSAYGMSNAALNNNWAQVQQNISRNLSGKPVTNWTRNQLGQLWNDFSNKSRDYINNMQNSIPYYKRGQDLVNQGADVLTNYATPYMKTAADWMNQGGQTYNKLAQYVDPWASGSNIAGGGNFGGGGASGSYGTGPAAKYVDSIYATTANDIANQAMSQAAAAGRSVSPGFAQAEARGMAQGLTPIKLGQYNQDVQNMLNAQQILGTVGSGQLNTGAGYGNLSQGAVGVGGAYGNLGATEGNLGTAQANVYNTMMNAELARNNAGVQYAMSPEQFAQQGFGNYGQSLSMPFIPVTSYSNVIQPYATEQSTNSSSFGMDLGGVLSDRRAKQDIEMVGKLFDGTPVYRFRYIGSPVMQIGLMADDIEEMYPEAVSNTNPGGLKRIDYKVATDAAAFLGEK